MGQTIICPFKALRHPTVIIRNCAFGPNSVFYVLYKIMKRDRCYFRKQRQQFGVCKGDVAEVGSEIIYLTQKYLSLRRVTTEFCNENVLRNGLQRIDSWKYSANTSSGKKINFHFKINTGTINWTRLLIVLSLKDEHNQNRVPKEAVSSFLKTLPILLRNLEGKSAYFNITQL